MSGVQKFLRIFCPPIKARDDSLTLRVCTVSHAPLSKALYQVHASHPLVVLFFRASRPWDPVHPVPSGFSFFLQIHFWDREVLRAPKIEEPLKQNKKRGWYLCRSTRVAPSARDSSLTLGVRTTKPISPVFKSVLSDIHAVIATP